MKTHSAAALFFLAGSLSCLADTFTLKDGSTIEGKIIHEDATSYVLEVQVTKSIKDERTVAKADVAKIAREELDLTAFAEVQKLVPTPDFLTADEYVQRVSTVNGFLKTYPDSAKTKEAKVILETLKSEVAKIEAGGIKTNGELISPAAYKANAYELDARVQEARIRNLIAARQPLAALRVFSEFDQDYRTTLSYGALAPLIKQLVQVQVEEARQQLLTLDSRLKERQIGLDRMTNEDRPVTERAIQEQDEAIEARHKAEKDAKISWVTTSPFHKPSLEETVRFGEAELARLASITTVLGVDGGRSYREAWSAIHSGADAAAVATAIAAARSASVPPRYLEVLEKAAKK
jgi:hypothetical protein